MLLMRREIVSDTSDGSGGGGGVGGGSASRTTLSLPARYQDLHLALSQLLYYHSPCSLDLHLARSITIIAAQWSSSCIAMYNVVKHTDSTSHNYL